MASYTAQSREAGRAPIPVGTRVERDNRWWVQPLLTVLVLSAFGIYVTWRAFENAHFIWPGPEPRFLDPDAAYRAVENATYLSPMYSPYIPLRWTLGTWTISPAIYILIFPLSFRLTCYYYRKAYYRSFFWDPPACALAEPNPRGRMSYLGERVFPFILQNLHRFAFYAAVVFILILLWDAIKALFFVDVNGVRHFGIGVGTIIFWINIVLLSAYTFGCHSCRHLIGGKVDCYSCSALTRTRYGLWQKVSFLNKRHALFAWCSLISVAAVDIYVNLVSRGIITDLRIR